MSIATSIRFIPSLLAAAGLIATLAHAITSTLTPFMALIGLPLLLLAIATAGLLAEHHLDRRSSRANTRRAERSGAAHRPRLQVDYFSIELCHPHGRPLADSTAQTLPQTTVSATVSAATRKAA